MKYIPCMLEEAHIYARFYYIKLVAIKDFTMHNRFGCRRSGQVSLSRAFSVQFYSANYATANGVTSAIWPAFLHKISNSFYHRKLAHTYILNATYPRNPSTASPLGRSIMIKVQLNYKRAWRLYKENRPSTWKNYSNYIFWSYLTELQVPSSNQLS